MCCVGTWKRLYRLYALWQVLQLPARQYFSFRREARVVQRVICEHDARVAERRWALLFRDSRFAGRQRPCFEDVKVYVQVFESGCITLCVQVAKRGGYDRSIEKRVLWRGYLTGRNALSKRARLSSPSFQIV